MREKLTGFRAGSSKRPFAAVVGLPLAGIIILDDASNAGFIRGLCNRNGQCELSGGITRLVLNWIASLGRERDAGMLVILQRPWGIEGSGEMSWLYFPRCMVWSCHLSLAQMRRGRVEDEGGREC